MRKGTAIYDYLEKTGVLSVGTATEISEAKKKYWSTVRNEWKKKRRQECQGFTIFFTKDEMKTINEKVKSGAVSTFIKQATLSFAQDKPMVNKKLLGEIRAVLFTHYQELHKLIEITRFDKIENNPLQTAKAIEEKLFKLL